MRRPRTACGPSVDPKAFAGLLARRALGLAGLRSLVAVVGVIALSAAGCGLVAQARSSCTVQRIIDGDTFVCGSGERVRLILVNTPEMSDRPLGRMARDFLVELMPPGTEVELEMDVSERDRYGRLLAYVWLTDGRMVNRALVRRGYAQVMVVPPDVRYVERVRAAADSARMERVGLWGRSPGLGPPPGAPGGSGTSSSADSPTDSSPGSCDPAYPGLCIPPPPPDLDCRDIPHRRFQVRAPDPHRFDGDGNGVGCEDL